MWFSEVKVDQFYELNSIKLAADNSKKERKRLDGLQTSLGEFLPTDGCMIAEQIDPYLSIHGIAKEPNKFLERSWFDLPESCDYSGLILQLSTSKYLSTT
ncbi:unnamed protein product [Musa banksii]